ncbi:MAG TPA: hypothetical protein VF598_08780, partial [Hymenobacter sp.]
MPTLPDIKARPIHVNVFGLTRPEEEFNLFIISDLYDDPLKFTTDCYKIKEKLFSIYPFSLGQNQEKRIIDLNIFACFVDPSTVPVTGSGPYNSEVGQSALGIAYNSSTGSFSINYQKFEQVARSIKVYSVAIDADL